MNQEDQDEYKYEDATKRLAYYWVTALIFLDEMTIGKRLEANLMPKSISRLLQLVIHLLSILYLELYCDEDNVVLHLRELARHYLTLIIKALPSWGERDSGLTVQIKSHLSKLLMRFVQNTEAMEDYTHRQVGSHIRPFVANTYALFQDSLLTLGENKLDLTSFLFSKVVNQSEPDSSYADSPDTDY